VGVLADPVENVSIKAIFPPTNLRDPADYLTTTRVLDGAGLRLDRINEKELPTEFSESVRQSDPGYIIKRTRNGRSTDQRATLSLDGPSTHVSLDRAYIP
jgi:hypothetical protein